MHANLTDQYQNLKRDLFVTLNKANLQSFHLIYLRIIYCKDTQVGSRSWEVIDNGQPALSYTQTLQSLGTFFTVLGNGTSFT